MQPDMHNEFVRRVDRDVLVYVREMQQKAPVTQAAVAAFLRGPRDLGISDDMVGDRLAYLVDLGDLRVRREWRDGAMVRFEISAQGRDRLDGVIPPANWSA